MRDDNCYGGAHLLLAFIAGGIAGAAVALLAAPQSGTETRGTIRGLAREQRVSVITVMRAYNDLEHEGLLRSRRGKGFWVAPMPEKRKHTMAEERFTDALGVLVAHAAAEGLSAAEMRRILDKLLRKGARK